MGNASPYAEYSDYKYNNQSFNGGNRSIADRSTSTIRLKRTLRGHTDTVTSIAYSKNGRYIITSSSDRTAKLWDVETGESIQTYVGHNWTVWCARISSHDELGSSFVVTTSSDCSVIVWHALTGDIIQNIKAHDEPIFCAAISADNRYIVTGSADETCKLICTDGNSNHSATDFMKTFSGHRGSIFAVAFTSDVQNFVSASDDGTVKLWNVNVGTVMRTFTGHKRPVLSVSISSDNNFITTSSSDQKAILWNMSTGLEVRRYTGHTGTVSCVTMPSVDDVFDSSIIITGSYEKSVKIWNRHTGEQLHTLEGHHNYVTSVTFHPTNKSILATGSDDQCVKIWDLSSLPIMRNMAWNSVRHFVMLRWLVDNSRASPRSMQTDSSKAFDQEALQSLIMMDTDDVFKLVLSFIIPTSPSISPVPVDDDVEMSATLF